MEADVYLDLAKETSRSISRILNGGKQIITKVKDVSSNSLKVGANKVTAVILDT